MRNLLLAGAALVGALGIASYARADNYDVKDGNAAHITMCSKLIGGVNYNCHVNYGYDGANYNALSVNASGRLQVDIVSGAVTASGTITATGSTSNASDGVATGAVSIPSVAYNYNYNGTAWDRVYNAKGLGDGSSGVGIGSAAIWGWNGATFDRLQVDASKFLKVNCASGCSGGTFNNNADGVATSATNGQSADWMYGFNGATWDRLRTQTSPSGLIVVPKHDHIATGTVTAVGNTVALATEGSGDVVIEVTANTNVTLVTEGQLASGAWYLLNSYQLGGGNALFTIPANTTGNWVMPAAGFTGVRVRVTVIGATPTATINLSDSNSSSSATSVVSPTAANFNVTAAQGGTWNINAITTLPALPNFQSSNVAQVNGVTTTTGNGIAGTGVQRVAIASDNTAFPVNNTSQVCSVVTTCSITPVVSAALESGHVGKASAGALFSASVTTDGAPAIWYFMGFNSTTVPADGAVTPVFCIPVGAFGIATWTPAMTGGVPEWYTTGISVTLSSTGCFTKTAQVHGFFNIRVK